MNCICWKDGVLLLYTTVVVLCFFSFLLKKVLKQETIALDVKVKVSMKCEDIDTDEPLTRLPPAYIQNESDDYSTKWSTWLFFF